MSEPVELTLSWQPELEDYKQAFQGMRRVQRTRELVGLVIVVAVIILVCGVVLDEGLLVGAGLGGAVGVAFAAGPGTAMGVRSFWRRSASLRLPVEVRLSAAGGVTSTVPGSSGHYDWSFWAGFLETERVFVLRTGRRKGVFMVIAKRGLPSDADVATLRELLQSATSGEFARLWSRAGV